LDFIGIGMFLFGVHCHRKNEPTQMTHRVMADVVAGLLATVRGISVGGVLGGLGGGIIGRASGQAGDFIGDQVTAVAMGTVDNAFVNLPDF
jgi:hypothetical protein